MMPKMIRKTVLILGNDRFELAKGFLLSAERVTCYIEPFIREKLISLAYYNHVSIEIVTLWGELLNRYTFEGVTQECIKDDEVEFSFTHYTLEY